MVVVVGGGMSVSSISLLVDGVSLMEAAELQFLPAGQRSAGLIHLGPDTTAELF